MGSKSLNNLLHITHVKDLEFPHPRLIGKVLQSKSVFKRRKKSEEVMKEDREIKKEEKSE